MSTVEPAGSARERRKARARVEIARAALELFQRQGYDATTVSDIAQAADYSERSFYRFFATKEDVVFFDIGYLLDDVRAEIAAVPAGGSLWPVIRDAVLRSIAGFQEPGLEFAAEVLRTWMTDPALAGPFLRFCGRWHEVFAEGWNRVYGAGGDPLDDLDAQLAAHYVVSTCQACFRVHVQTGHELLPLLERGFERLDQGLHRYR